MITNYEKKRVKEIQDALLDSVVLSLDGEEISREEFLETNMATIDALFAIREGEPWRGMIDPKEIARAVLRAGQIGE